jgi:O-antigen/teichoic acid export membrane protein
MAIAQIARSVLRLCLTVTFLSVLDLGITGLILSWTASFAVSVLYQYLVLPISRTFMFRRPLVTEMLRFGIPLQGIRFLWFMLRRLDVFLLATLAGPASVAFYDVAFRIPDALQRLSESFTAVFFPTVSSLLGEGKRERATVILNHSLRLLSFATALLTIAGIVFSREIVTLLFSQKYADASLAFALFMLSLHMTCLVNLMGYMLTATGKPGRSLIADSIRTTVHGAGDLLLIPRFSYVGTAYAAIAAAYIANPIAVWFLRRSGIRTEVLPYAKQTGLLLTCAALFWAVHPSALAFRMAIVLLFVVLNVALSTISRDDLSLVLPDRLSKRPRIREEAVPYDH